MNKEQLMKNLADFDKAFNAQLEQRNNVISDQRFVDVTGAQWDNAYGEQFANRPKMELDKISREINRIIGEYNANPIGVNFVPETAEADDKVGNVLTDRFRHDYRKSSGQEATDNAFSEAVKGGFGAFRLTNKYENENDPDANAQYICFEPIFSAAATVVWDANAKKIDKSDAKKCWVLHEMIAEDFHEEYPGVAPFNDSPVTTQQDEFTWYSKDVVYVAEYYEVKTVKHVRLVFQQPDGAVIKIDKDELNDTVSAQIVEWEQIDREEYTEVFVEKSLLCGDEVLEKPQRISGVNIPVVPVYGYHSYIKGKEYYYGEVRKQKDRQTFWNMGVSALAEMMGESHKEKPIFTPEQVARYEHMWTTDNTENYPYLYADPLYDQNGNIIHAGPIGSTTSPQIPPALAGALQMLNQDFAEELGTGEVNIPANTSGVAVQQVQNRADMSYFRLIHNMRIAMRRAGEIYKGMAKEIYGVSRTIRTISEDGTYSMANMMQPDFDDTNMMYISNDVTRGEYEVVVKTGKSYSSRMQAERET